VLGMVDGLNFFQSTVSEMLQDLGREIFGIIRRPEATRV